MANLPTLYEHYTSGGITTGLSVDQPYFTLNGKNISIYSGSLHYFRVPRAYWRDRLRKMRAAGLNAVSTYTPWNLHEPQPGVYDFGDGGSDLEDFLHLEEFLRTVQEEDMFAIVRPGPYSSAELDLGGLPSWLLKDDTFPVRTSNPPTFMQYVTRYFNVLLPILAALQFINGGPIISFQVENEYGKVLLNETAARPYLEELRQLFLDNGIKELLTTCDSPRYGHYGTIPGVLFQEANFGANAESSLQTLQQLQDGPLMVSEFWSGWFDSWGDEKHNTKSASQFESLYETILKFPASVNLYMFIGGTNFGFMNGANSLNPTTTSYDYDAPLTENGAYTEKYDIVKKLIAQYNTIQTKLPDPPEEIKAIAFDDVTVQSQLNFDEIVNLVPERVNSVNPISMEKLDINNGTGQGYGYVVYRKMNIDIRSNAVLKIGGHVRDFVEVLVNGNLVSESLQNSSQLSGFGYWKIEDGELTLSLEEDVTDGTLELLVENWGRNNVGTSVAQSYKGIWEGAVYLDGEEVTNWEIVPLQFRKNWNLALEGWHDITEISVPKPSIYKAILTVDEPTDTFLDMRNWTKGIVIANGFVLGRYCSPLGPQQTLYFPAPLQVKGDNEILIFEHFYASDKVVFSSDLIFG